MQDIFKGFQDVNRAAEWERLVHLLDTQEELDCVKECKRLMLELCSVGEGDRILDVGCGVGHEAQRLAKLVGPRGRVVGIDRGESNIAEARRRAAGLSFPVEFQINDAHQLTFTDHSFDLVRAERVLLFVEDPRRVLNEMVRVVRPGGGIVIFDFDHDGFVLDVADQAFFRRIKDLLFKAVPNGAIGRQLPRLLRESGLIDIRVIPHVFVAPYRLWRSLVEGTLIKELEAGTVSALELDRWWSELAAADREGQFFEASLGFIVPGQKTSTP